jgi:hypothetical protein
MAAGQLVTSPPTLRVWTRTRLEGAAPYRAATKCRATSIDLVAPRTLRRMRLSGAPSKTSSKG